MRRGGAGSTTRARRQRNVERDERSPPKSIAKRTAEPLLEDKRRKDQKPRRGRKSPNPNIMKGRTQRQLSHKGGKRYPVRYQGGNLEDPHAAPWRSSSVTEERTWTKTERTTAKADTTKRRGDELRARNVPVNDPRGQENGIRATRTKRGVTTGPTRGENQAQTSQPGRPIKTDPLQNGPRLWMHR